MQPTSVAPLSLKGKQVASPILMVVEIFADGEDEKAEQSYLVDFAYPPTREWIERVIHFSMLNGKSINIDPATKQDLENKSVYVPRKDKEAVAA